MSKLPRQLDSAQPRHLSQLRSRCRRLRRRTHPHSAHAAVESIEPGSHCSTLARLGASRSVCPVVPRHTVPRSSVLPDYGRMCGSSCLTAAAALVLVAGTAVAAAQEAVAACLVVLTGILSVRHSCSTNTYERSRRHAATCSTTQHSVPSREMLTQSVNSACAAP